jgi:hypothetical protein
MHAYRFWRTMILSINSVLDYSQKAFSSLSVLSVCQVLEEVMDKLI